MKSDGFTLLELLIVAAIIGILAALAIPNYAMFKGNALNATAAADARNLAPAADYASSSVTTAVQFSVGPGGGPIVNLPGGTSSPGTLGTVLVDPNCFAITTMQPQGGLCYQIDSYSGTGMQVYPAPCNPLPPCP